MKNYPFSFESLSTFSNSIPYSTLSKNPNCDQVVSLFQKLNDLKNNYHFPAINNDIGEFLKFMQDFWKPKTIFEMGSGYGHSAFWFMLGIENSLLDFNEIILTEKRDDLETEFHRLPWPATWKEKMSYHQADAFDVLEKTEKVDLALIDGVKADYIKFLKSLENKMSDHGIVVIDNSYWRGSFLDQKVKLEKQTAKKIAELHEYIAETQNWEGLFIPYIDGLTILKFLPRRD